MMRRVLRSLPAWIGVAVICAVAAAPPAEAQARREFVGPGKCTDCHDHKDEKEWSEKRDGDGKGKQHLNALNQLADAKADVYAKATGVADVYDPKSTCVKCHASVVRGSADFGISCESCHGGGKDYLKPHQEKGAYQAALALGMKDTQKKPENWVKDCVTCHVLGDSPGDAALVKAGHSSGADFDLGVKFQPVQLGSLAGTVLLVALLVLVSLWASGQIEAAAEARRHTYVSISGANALLSELKTKASQAERTASTSERFVSGFWHPTLAFGRARSKPWPS